MRLDLTSLRKAVASLEAVLAKDKDEFIRDSAIQRFEYTYELSWKFLTRHLAQELGGQAVDKFSRRDLYRIGAEKGLIRDAASWFEYHTARNLTSHSYNISVAEQVYDTASRFLSDAKWLLDSLSAIHE